MTELSPTASDAAARADDPGELLHVVEVLRAHLPADLEAKTAHTCSQLTAAVGIIHRECSCKP